MSRGMTDPRRADGIAGLKDALEKAHFNVISITVPEGRALLSALETRDETLAQAKQDRDAQFAHNGQLVERVEELEPRPRRSSEMADEFAWVIERYILGKLHYWTGRPERGVPWSEKHEDAIRFARHQDAFIVLAHLCDGIGNATEHGWRAAPPQTETEPR